MSDETLNNEELGDGTMPQGNDVGSFVPPIQESTIPTEHTAPPAPSSEAVESLSKRLEETREASEVDPSAPEAVQPLPFDITALKPEQLAVLKQQLSNSPDRVLQKKKNPTVTLRQLQGKLIIDFKNSFLSLKTNTVERRDVEIHVIPVLFLGETEFTNVELFNFHNAERVKCEIVDHSSKKEEYLEGTTISRDTGKEVEMFSYIVIDIFTLKLPNGELIKINSKIVNA